MKFALGLLALVFTASTEANPQGTFSDVKYFENGLDEIQGAILDTIAAGEDLKLVETRLQNIVDASSFFYRAESAIEYAVDASGYTNGWSSDSFIAGNVGKIFSVSLSHYI